ncbi:MAG: hypothetical protein R3264_00485 [Anaerolineae bacterium]|nr:hypothetical protein [Anaerolineae bacterium]
MSLYMTQFSYPPQDWSKFLKNSTDNIFTPSFKEKGIRLHQIYCCSEEKGLMIFEAPDETTALRAISASALLDSVEVYETMPLFTIEEIVNHRANFTTVSEGPQPPRPQAMAADDAFEGRYRFLGWVDE